MNSRSFFSDFDFAQFWEQSDYATKEYVGAAITDHLIKQVETRLGYTLPKSYVEFMKFQNGGIPKRTHHRIKLSDDYIVITGIYSIGDEKPCSLCGEFGSQFWIAECGYPPIGIYFADCPQPATTCCASTIVSRGRTASLASFTSIKSLTTNPCWLPRTSSSSYADSKTK